MYFLEQIEPQCVYSFFLIYLAISRLVLTSVRKTAVNFVVRTFHSRQRDRSLIYRTIYVIMLYRPVARRLAVELKMLPRGALEFLSYNVCRASSNLQPNTSNLFFLQR